VVDVSSFSAWLLFAESAKACGSNLTMDCGLKNAKTYIQTLCAHRCR
jgi:hypothetical protein